MKCYLCSVFQLFFQLFQFRKPPKPYLNSFTGGVLVRCLPIFPNLIGLLIGFVSRVCANENKILVHYIPGIVLNRYLLDYFGNIPS